MVLLMAVMSAVAADDPFASEPESQSAQDSGGGHQAQALGLTVAGIMGTPGRLLAVLETVQGHFYIVGNGDALEKEGVEVVKLDWEKVVVRRNGEIYQLPVPRTSF